VRETVTASWQHYLVLLRRATIGMRMTVTTGQLLQDGGAPEYVYHDRTAWCCVVFVGKSYGSKGISTKKCCPCTVNITCHFKHFHLFGPLKQHLSGERFPDDDAVERGVCAWFRQQPQEFYATGLQGLVKRWDKFFNLYGDYVEK